jgi:hypothetical protein
MVRLELSVKMPLAVNPKVPFTLATADAGFTLRLFKLGWPAPQATVKSTENSTTGKYFIGSPKRLE